MKKYPYVSIVLAGDLQDPSKLPRLILTTGKSGHDLSFLNCTGVSKFLKSKGRMSESEVIWESRQSRSGQKNLAATTFTMGMNHQEKQAEARWAASKQRRSTRDYLLG